MRAPFSVVIITGASSGLGASLAKAYAAPHVALGLHGRDRQRLEATARACEALGATVNTAIIDVTDAPAMASWLREFDDRHPVDLLIANAGTSAGPPLTAPRRAPEQQPGRSELTCSAPSTPSSPFCRSCARAGAAALPWSRRSPPIGGSPTVRGIVRAKLGCAPTPRHCGLASSATASV